MVLGTRLVYGADAQTTTARHRGKVSGEPDAVIPHVRFCRGSRPKRHSLKQPSLEAAFYLPRGSEEPLLLYLPTAETLLRIILAYAWNDWSLRTTAAWASRIGLADLSDVAILKRLRRAPAWLGHLLDQWFRSQGIGTPVKSRFRLVLTDGSTIQRPGSSMLSGILARVGGNTWS